MKVCLITFDSDELLPLARNLAGSGHQVELLTSASTSSFAKDETGVGIHRVRPMEMPNDSALLSLCLTCSRHQYLMASALWEKFSQLNETLAFDIVDASDAVMASLLPGLTKSIPMLIRQSTGQEAALLPNGGRVAYSFDRQLVSMTRKLSLTLAEAVLVDTEASKATLQANLNLPADKIFVVKNREASDAILDLYKQCQVRFEETSTSPLYRRGVSNMPTDASSLYLALDRALYDLFYVQSYKFRLRHWLRKLTARQDSALGKIVRTIVPQKLYENVI